MNADTLLYRQVNSSWIQQGRVTSQVFRPTPKDEKRLSVYDGAQINAEAAWAHFTSTLGHSSVGVLAVTHGECVSQQLPVVPDPVPFPEHVYIDFAGLTKGQILDKSKHLRAAAEQRGWQYRAEARP